MRDAGSAADTFRMSFWAFSTVARDKGRLMRAWVTLLSALACVFSVLASSASAHNGVHADDFAHGIEVPAPDGVTAGPVTISGRLADMAGPRKVAVLLFNFTDNRTEPWTADQVRTAIFTGASSVNAFEQEQSFGTLSLEGKVRADGDIFGWYPLNVSSATCDPWTWKAVADSLAEGLGEDLSGYQHYVYMFPEVPACGWAGTAQMPGTNLFLNGTTSVRVIAHELGHNLGAHHASGANCVNASGARVAFSTSCTFSEYGDPFDVMGYTDRQSAAFRKVGYGFLSAAETQTVTQSGTYSVSTSSIGGPGIRSLRVARAPGDYWYLDIRSTTGQYDDYFMLDPAVGGLTIRRAGDYGDAVRTLLIDTNPNTANFGDAPLGPGQTFTDAEAGITVTLQSVALGVATVNVAVPGPPPVPPTQVVPPPADGGTTVTPPPPVVTPPPAPVVMPTATISVRRVSRTAMSVRLSTAAPSGARTCLARAGALSWRSCIISAGRITVTRTVPVTRTTVLVSLLLDGKLALSKRVRVPKAGATTRATAALV